MDFAGEGWAVQPKRYLSLNLHVALNTIFGHGDQAIFGG
jgi:hypothetical protein